MSDTFSEFLVQRGNKLKELRNNAGLSQQALGDTLGISKQEVSHIEVGRRKGKLSIIMSWVRICGGQMADIVVGGEGFMDDAVERLPHMSKEQLEAVAIAIGLIDGLEPDKLRQLVSALNLLSGRWD